MENEELKKAWWESRRGWGTLILGVSFIFNLFDVQIPVEPLTEAFWQFSMLIGMIINIWGGVEADQKIDTTKILPNREDVKKITRNVVMNSGEKNERETSERIFNRDGKSVSTSNKSSYRGAIKNNSTNKKTSNSLSTQDTVSMVDKQRREDEIEKESDAVDNSVSTHHERNGWLQQGRIQEGSNSRIVHPNSKSKTRVSSDPRGLFSDDSTW